MLAGTSGTATAAAQSKHGEDDFIRLIDASPAMMWLAAADGFCLHASHTWLEFRGRTLEQELGTGWTEEIHPEDRERSLRELWSAAAASRPFRLYYRIRNAEGTYVQVENAGTPWCGVNGKDPGGYIGRITVFDQKDEDVRAAISQLFSLSPRERQILELIARGYATKEAAGQLGISYKTADSHRSHVLKKLGLHETASVVRFAIRSGLISA
jgi:PAS domain S-box-containing protein